MAKIDPARLWALNYRIVTGLIASVTTELDKVGIEVKELFVLAEIDEFPHPAALATRLLMPKPTVTFHLKRLTAGGLVKREVDTRDLRKHRLTLTPAGRKAMTRGMALLSQAFGERLDRLTSAQQLEFASLLEKLA